jgi:hypothetical protein
LALTVRSMRTLSRAFKTANRDSSRTQQPMSGDRRSVTLDCAVELVQSVEAIKTSQGASRASDGRLLVGLRNAAM